MAEQFSYDQLPYPSYTFPKSFPDRLATMAALYGIEAADPSSCRLLELGCGDGTNLLAMAYTTLESRFTGIDLSKVHIEKARRSAEWIGANNASFLQADVSEFDPKSLGEFDYIVTHGLFSWVPEHVRASILRIYSECLAAKGIGYISYNAFPGAHIRRMLWEMMRFHSDGEKGPAERVKKAREIAVLIAESVDADTPYGAVLQREVEKIIAREDQGLFHDDLENLNQPFYFYEFVERLKQNGLRYFAEADPEPGIERLSTKQIDRINEVSDHDTVRREQLLDFIRGQRFRCSLFCRDSVLPLDNVSHEALDSLLLTTRLEQDVSSTDSVTFVGPNGQKIELNHPLTITVLKNLKNEWPRAVPFRQALDAISDPGIVGTDDDLATCRRYLFDLFNVELVEIHCFQAPFVRDVSAKPEVSRFARLQVELGSRVVTTMAGANIELSSPALRVLTSLLDGRRDLQGLTESMAERIEVPEAEELTLREQLPQMIESNLQKMCDLGLLIG
jgi:SAM-dependent methyltransferase/methyltransferase-like protein